MLVLINFTSNCDN